jgi:uncharacterized UBP type Zn finger protein
LARAARINLGGTPQQADSLQKIPRQNARQTTEATRYTVILRITCVRLLGACRKAGGDVGRTKQRSGAMPSRCSHLNSVLTSNPNTDGCEECLAMGDTWVHLRLCRSCGHVGCCDDSKNRHATKHFRSTQHPIMTSLEPGEDWSWCYIDELAMELG